MRTALTLNINAPKGSFDGLRQSYAIGANDQILLAEEYRPRSWPTPMARLFGSVTSAKRVDNVENIRLAARVGNTPSVILDIQRQPGANIIETADRVKALLPYRKPIPPAIKVSIMTDRPRPSVSVSDVHLL